MLNEKQLFTVCTYIVFKSKSIYYQKEGCDKRDAIKENQRT